jgi:hypothetical protein
MKHDMTVIIGRADLPLKAVDVVAGDMYSGEPCTVNYGDIEYKVYNHTIEDWNELVTVISCLYDHMENVDIAEMEIDDQYDVAVDIDGDTLYAVVTVFTYYGSNRMVQVHYVGK